MTRARILKACNSSAFVHISITVRSG